MPEILLSTLNARYIHTAFGLRYLLANLGELRPRAGLLEFDINQRPLDIVEQLLGQAPKIIGFGVYIWNVAETTAVVASLKRLRPDIVIVLGGPEISYETAEQPLAGLADYVISGEADVKFAELCRQVLAGSPPAARLLAAELPDLARLELPYDLYDERDIANRIIYVEASRGCPFTCEFCLSSLEIPVRAFPLSQLLGALEQLLARGARQFKFVDRTFNLNLRVSRSILEFALEHYRPGLFFHFELVPDRLPGELRELIRRFPPGALQFEVGIQTFNDEVAALIRRRQNYARVEENLRFLRTETGVHVHADLIAGLPGETLESFAAGFDRLVALGPQEIQVGLLKRLRGTPIVRHDRDWEMLYNPDPPYEILRNRLIGFPQMQQLRRFGRYWDLVGNSGNFIDTTPLIWLGGVSPFQAFMRWSQWLHQRLGQTDRIALLRLMQLLFEFLTGELKQPPDLTAAALWRDYKRSGREDKPGFLKNFLPPGQGEVRPRVAASGRPKRQRRHSAAGAATAANGRG
jgi:radical SAM superfamily enzyme YgiQ (UPF0313 family)